MLFSEGHGRQSFWLENTSGIEDWVLATGEYDTLQVVIYDANGKLIDENRGGWIFPSVKGRHLLGIPQSPLLELHVPKGKSRIDLVFGSKRQDNKLTSLVPQLFSSASIHKSMYYTDILMALVSGVLLALIVYNLLLYFSVPEVIYLLYVVREVVFLVLWLTAYGYFAVWLWPESYRWNEASIWVIMPITGWLTAEFIIRFLTLNKVAPHLVRYGRIWMLSYLPFFALSWIDLSFLIYANYYLPVFLLIWVVRAMRVSEKAGFSLGHYFKIAFSFYLVGAFITILSQLAILPVNTFTLHVGMFGVLIEALWFSVGMAERINLFKFQAEQRKGELGIKAAENLAIQRNLEEKELLLKEIHHRVKNNLQVIYSLLSLQKEHTAEVNARAALENSQSRIMSMILVHQNLYKTDDLQKVDIANYISELLKNVTTSLDHENEGPHIEMACDSIMINTDTAIPVGLILNELITNAYKHAFHNQLSKRLLIKAKRLGSHKIALVVHDSGPGIAGFRQTNPIFNSLGLRLVYDLVHQLKGEIIYEHDEGSKFSITMPFSNNDK